MQFKVDIHGVLWLPQPDNSNHTGRRNGTEIRRRVRFVAQYNLTFAEEKKRIMDRQANLAPQAIIYQQPLEVPIPTFYGDNAS